MKTGGACLLAALIAVPAAVAQTPAEVRDGLGPGGVWVDGGTTDRAALEAQVLRAREAGVDLVVVVAADPQPDADAFALRVRQLDVGDPVLVFGPEGDLGVSSERADDTRLNRARDAAEDAVEPVAATEAFTTALLSDADEGVPDLVDDVVAVVILAMLVLGAVVVLEQAIRSAKRARRRRRDRAGPLS